jgi:Orange carotenoid protein, N-terminal
VSNVTSGLFTAQVEAFQKLDVDEQLALFWVIYTEMGDSITPAAPGASTVSSDIAQALFDRVKSMSHDEQLQIMRDLIARQNSLICREYGALSDTTKLLFWYLLAQGMDDAVIVPFPEDYQLSSESEDLLEQIKNLEFSQQITLFRDIVAPMGVDPNEVPHDEATGL